MKNGFTLLEVLLSIVLIGILVGVSVPAYYTLFYKNDLDVAKNQVAQSLGRAAFLALSSDGDNNWGVQIQTGVITIFQGASYSSRNTDYDETYSIASSITPSGLTEIVFNKMTGLPQSTGDIILTSTNGDTKTITINSKGTVNY